jgi:hypothetical protein
LPAEIHKAHQDFYQRHAEVLAAKLHTAFQNITNAPKTPTSPALESTLRRDPDGEVPPEAKLCMSTGATLGTAQKSRTLKLGIQQAALTVPQQHISAAERLLKDYILRAVYGHTDQSDLVLAPRLGQITLVLKNIRHSTTFT